MFARCIPASKTDPNVPWAVLKTGRSTHPQPSPTTTRPLPLVQASASATRAVARPGAYRGRRGAVRWALRPSRRPASFFANPYTVDALETRETERPKEGPLRCRDPLNMRGRRRCWLTDYLCNFHVTHVRASCPCATRWILEFTCFPPCCVGHVRKPSQANGLKKSLCSGSRPAVARVGVGG